MSPFWKFAILVLEKILKFYLQPHRFTQSIHKTIGSIWLVYTVQKIVCVSNSKWKPTKSENKEAKKWWNRIAKISFLQYYQLRKALNTFQIALNLNGYCETIIKSLTHRSIFCLSQLLISIYLVFYVVERARKQTKSKKFDRLTTSCEP